MEEKYTKTLKEIEHKKIFKYLDQNFNYFSIEWMNVITMWLSNSYSAYSSHNKYLIHVYLLKSYFEFLSKNLVKIDWEDFFKLTEVEIKKFNIAKISKDLLISKETTRRKIEELEAEKTIKKTLKTTKIKLNVYNYKFQEKNKKFIKLMCKFLTQISEDLYKKGIIYNDFNKEELEKTILKNYSHVWKEFFEMILPFWIDWKKIFGNVETFHTYLIVFQNNNYEIQKYLKFNKINITNKKDYILMHSKIIKKTGINTMSISNLSGIPRATVIRKLNLLVKNNFLNTDNKKLYYPTIDQNMKSKIIKQNSKNMERLSIFITKIYNLTITSI